MSFLAGVLWRDILLQRRIRQKPRKSDGGRGGWVVMITIIYEWDDLTATLRLVLSNI